MYIVVLATLLLVRQWLECRQLARGQCFRVRQRLELGQARAQWVLAPFGQKLRAAFLKLFRRRHGIAGRQGCGGGPGRRDRLCRSTRGRSLDHVDVQRVLADADDIAFLEHLCHNVLTVHLDSRPAAQVRNPHAVWRAGNLCMER